MDEEAIGESIYSATSKFTIDSGALYIRMRFVPNPETNNPKPKELVGQDGINVKCCKCHRAMVPVITTSDEWRCNECGIWVQISRTDPA